MEQNSLFPLKYRIRKPQRCEVCGTTNPNMRYEWANVSGDYTDMDGFKRMCASCHRKFDRSENGVRRNVK